METMYRDSRTQCYQMIPCDLIRQGRNDEEIT